MLGEGAGRGLGQRVDGVGALATRVDEARASASAGPRSACTSRASGGRPRRRPPRRPGRRCSSASSWARRSARRRRGRRRSRPTSTSSGSHAPRARSGSRRPRGSRAHAGAATPPTSVRLRSEEPPAATQRPRVPRVSSRPSASRLESASRRTVRETPSSSASSRSVGSRSPAPAAPCRICEPIVSVAASTSEPRLGERAVSPSRCCAAHRPNATSRSTPDARRDLLVRPRPRSPRGCSAISVTSAAVRTSGGASVALWGEARTRRPRRRAACWTAVPTGWRAASGPPVAGSTKSRQ